MKKLFYLAYYIKETPKGKFFKFLDVAAKFSGRSKLNILSDVVGASLKHNISVLDYFYFRFYEKNECERQKWAGTGYMYEYQLKMNPKVSRDVLEDKRIFLEKYHDFVLHKFVTLEQIENSEPNFAKIMNNPSGKIVFKDALGQCGFGIEITNAKDWTRETLVQHMKAKKFNLLESFVQQANELQELSPSGLNTIRIFTQLTKNDEVVFLGCRLRISVNSQVDNMASGNMAAVVDYHTGVVISDGIYSDISKSDSEIHPVTGVRINGFVVPFWKETIEMITKAALLDARNRSVGWDIAITSQGPELIEGNHNWCKLLWQLPEKKGLKHLIAPYNHV
jgi:hypothetical protein